MQYGQSIADGDIHKGQIPRLLGEFVLSSFTNCNLKTFAKHVLSVSISVDFSLLNHTHYNIVSINLLLKGSIELLKSENC